MENTPSQKRKDTPKNLTGSFQSRKDYFEHRLQTAINTAEVAVNTEYASRPKTKEIKMEMGTIAHQRALARFAVETGADPGHNPLSEQTRNRIASSLGHDPWKQKVNYMEEGIFHKHSGERPHPENYDTSPGHTYHGTFRQRERLGLSGKPKGTFRPDIIFHKGSPPIPGTTSERDKDFSITGIVDLKFGGKPDKMQWRTKGRQYQKYAELGKQHGVTPRLMGPTKGIVGRTRPQLPDTAYGKLLGTMSTSNPLKWSPKVKAIHRRKAAVMDPVHQASFRNYQQQRRTILKNPPSSDVHMLSYAPHSTDDLRRIVDKHLPKKTSK